jgi:YbbR domain-containing protein
MPSLRNFLSHNGFLKLFSILLASLLWVTIATETSTVTNRTVPLEFRGIPLKMEITGETTTEVNLQVRGSSSLLNEISPSDIEAVLSLAGQAPGEKNLALSPQNILRPFGIEVLRVDPPRVQFNLERTMTRTLPVRANVEGVPAEDYEVVETQVVPNTVEVSGPESRVGPLEALTTTAIRIDGQRESIRAPTDLNVLDPLVRLLSLSPYEVVVDIREVEIENTYSITVDPSLDPDLWLIQPTTIDVTIRGPKSQMAEYVPTFIYFTIDTNPVLPGSQEVVPRVLGINAPLTVSSFEPERVQVVFREAP